MKSKSYICILVLIFFSCERRIIPDYEYEKNPLFTWGYAEFWGKDYAEYQIDNNVVSLSLFTDSLFLNEERELQGFGQYLYLEDVFLPSLDTLFPAGVYEVSGSKDTFTIAPGEIYKADSLKYDVGAYIYFIEKNEALTIRKFIVDGNMAVSYTEKTILFNFDFILNDKSEISGKFETKKFIMYDMSSIQPRDMKKQSVRLKR